MVTQDAPGTPHRVGPFVISHTPEELVLRLENRGELSWIGCLSLVFTMGVVLSLGLLSVIQPVQNQKGHFISDDPMSLFSPTGNHLAFFWMAGTVLMLGLVPFVVIRSYRAAMTFTFQKRENAFLRDKRRLTRLDRIENLTLQETRDPDSRYLYRLYVIYGDGRQILLHNGYDERELMNLANEVSSFIHVPVKWR